MSKKYWLCKREKVYYSFHSETGKRDSLQTSEKEEAARIVHGTNPLVLVNGLCSVG